MEKQFQLLTFHSPTVASRRLVYSTHVSWLFGFVKCDTCHVVVDVILRHVVTHQEKSLFLHLYSDLHSSLAERERFNEYFKSIGGTSELMYFESRGKKSPLRLERSIFLPRFLRSLLTSPRERFLFSDIIFHSF